MRSRFAAAALAVSLIGGAAVPATVLAPAAVAHSVLLESDPADGATVETAPDRVTLTFNEDINPSFVTVAVNGTDRTNRVRGEAEVEGAVVTAGIEGLDDDEYTVGYRVTSADGHVIQGSTRFTVGAGSAAGSAGPADPGGGSGAGASGEAGSADAEQAGADADADSSALGADAALWIVAGLAVLLIGAAALLLRRGRGD